MKLQQLSLGARFEYQGKVFVKTGPLTARSEDGGQQMIPRYAVLTPLDEARPEARAGRGHLSETTVRAAFDVFYRSCTRLLPEAEQASLEEARQRFFSSLKT